MPLAFFLTPTGLLVIALAIVSIGAGVQTVRLSSCQADSAETRASLEIAGDRLKQQNQAVSEWQAEAAKARQKGATAAKQAQAVAQSHAALVASLKARVAAPAPVSVATGKPQGCVEALQAIRAGK